MSDRFEKTPQLSPVKKALLEIRELRGQLDQEKNKFREPIAIIGMGMRFPGGANDAASFWHLLQNGVDAIDEIPPDRWDGKALYDTDPDTPGKMSTRWGGFLEQVHLFDPEFFGISPREAVMLDPQQRLLLEVAWESLENAGSAPDKLFGSMTGVFIGIGTFDYLQNHLRQCDPESIDAYYATGNFHSLASGRLSYVLGLRGPSISLDTACSSSLVAIHQACQSIRAGECDLALAGGVNVILRPELHINFSKSHVMASDGRCKTFDARADGFVRSEGCGMVVLKKFSDALRDGDNVLALIRGTAINQDGRSSGLTAPNGPSQQNVIRAALENAGIMPDQVQYVETHGTGTSLGDPIEVQALAAVLAKERLKSKPLVIGSVKTNLGHLEAGAGVASLIKVILALQHETIPPHLHFETPNPHIPWADIAVEVATGGKLWPVGSEARIAGISSFGFSGTNAHLLIEEAPKRASADKVDERPMHLLTLSAPNDLVLSQQAIRLTKFLGDESEAAIADVFHTANCGRSHFPKRLALVAGSKEQTRAGLEAYAQGESATGLSSGELGGSDPPEVVFMFTGQGAQHVGMASDLYQTQPVFREALDLCAEYLRTSLDRPLLSVIYPDDDRTSPLNQTAFTQPALFALEYALSVLWRSWGIEPAAVIGHSVGEYVAACVAGIFSLEEGLGLIAERGRLMQAQPEGGLMAAVFAEEDIVRAAIAPYHTTISIAAINSPGSIVVSGTAKSIQSATKQLRSQGVHSRELIVSHAFHSHLMEPMLADFELYASKIRFKDPVIPLVSNVSGDFYKSSQDGNADYWKRHVRETVHFAAGINTLYQNGSRVFLEIGPNPTLCGLGGQCIDDDTVHWLPSLSHARKDWQQMLESLGRVYTFGANVNWDAFDRPYRYQKVALPTYPFQRERYWLDENTSVRPTIDIENRRSIWDTLTTACQRQSMQAPIDLALNTYEAKWRSLQDLTTAYTVQALRQWGIFVHAGECYSLKEIMARCGIGARYEELLGRWLDRLTDEGLLQRQDQQFVSGQALPPSEPLALLGGARRAHADIDFLLDYVAQCGEALRKILTGRESPLATLFPEGSTQTADQLYAQWPLSCYFNGILSVALETLIHAMGPGRKMRILEIGSGVGGLTSSIVPLLPLNNTEYWYTDISDFFLAAGRDRFTNHPSIHFQTLDIESNPLEQGFGSHEFHVIIAGNTLHAVGNISNSLENILTLLSPEGVLLLCETTRRLPWFDITFGLLETEKDLQDSFRKGLASITAADWRDALIAKGFARTASFPLPGSPAEILGQHVLIAQRTSKSKADVEVRQPASSRYANESSDRVGARPQSEVENDVPAGGVSDQFWNAPVIERHEILMDYTRSMVRKVLRRDRSKPIGGTIRLMDFGVDSLMAVELRTLLKRGLGLTTDLPATLIFDYPTVSDISDFLMENLLSQNPSSLPDAPVEPVAKASAEDPPPTVNPDIDSLDEDDMEKLLRARLDMLEEGN